MDINTARIAQTAKEAQRQEKERVSLQNQQTDQLMNDYIANPSGQFRTFGTDDERAHQAANLSQVGVMTGQNMFQTGQQQQDYYTSMQNRRNGSDAVAESMMAGRNRNLANVGRQFAGRGVSGGVAAAGMNTAQNTADTSINAQKQEFGRQNDQDLWNYVKRNQKVTGDALAMGSQQGLADGMSTDTGSGIFGTVICTELHRQGLMSDEIYEKDAAYGKFLQEECPAIIRGYHLIGIPVAKRMRTSPLLTKIVKPFALAWAKHIAGEDNLLGGMIFFFGVPLCFVLGLFVPSRKVANA